MIAKNVHPVCLDTRKRKEKQITQKTKQSDKFVPEKNKSQSYKLATILISTFLNCR